MQTQTTTKPAKPSFDVSYQDRTTIFKIADRALALLQQRVTDGMMHQRQLPSFMDISMDVTAAHANGNPLRLHALLAADDFNFAHDVFGIHRHMNRDTGELGDCFVPRFSVPE